MCRASGYNPRKPLALVQIVPPEPGVVLQGLTVTPDGNFVDYIRRDRGNSELWRVSFLGGTPKKLLVDVRTPIGWSPDGRRLAFVREDLQRGKSELVVADADGGNLRVLAPTGIVTRLTNDLSSYVGVSLTAARDALVSARAEHRLSIWVGDGTGGPGKEVVSTVPSSAREVGLAWAGDRLLFPSTLGGQRAITSVIPGAGTPQEVISQAMSPVATADGRTVLFISTDPARPGLWKTTDGGRPVLVTPVATSNPSVTRDGRHVVFTTAQFGIQSLWMISIEGGTPIQIAERFAASAALSPDGKAVAFVSRDGRSEGVFLICDLPDCSSPRSLPSPPFSSGAGGPRKWTPDSKAITYVTGTPPNVWVQPVDGKPVRQLTRFTDDREISGLAWSHDGRRLAVVRVTTTNDIVLFKGLRK